MPWVRYSMIVFSIFKKSILEKVKLVSALGKLNYFKAMEKCDFMLGNTSSGIIEAASFGKYVVNVGDRQKGRLRNENVIDVPFDIVEILVAINSITERNHYRGLNKYVRLATYRYNY